MASKATSQDALWFSAEALAAICGGAADASVRRAFATRGVFAVLMRLASNARDTDTIGSVLDAIANLFGCVTDAWMIQLLSSEFIDVMSELCTRSSSLRCTVPLKHAFVCAGSVREVSEEDMA